LESCAAKAGGIIIINNKYFNLSPNRNFGGERDPQKINAQKSR
jgi:hypothetical protein